MTTAASATSKPNKIYGFASNINSMENSASPVRKSPSPSTVAIPAISFKLLGSASHNGKTPLDLLLANPIQFVKASLMSPVYNMTQKEAFGVANRNSTKTLRRVKNLPPTPQASPCTRKEYKILSSAPEGTKAKVSGTTPKVSLPTPVKDNIDLNDKPNLKDNINIPITINRGDTPPPTIRKDIVGEMSGSGATNNKPAMISEDITSTPQKLTDGDIEMPDSSPSPVALVSHDETKDAEILLPATVTSPSHAKILKINGLSIQNDTTKNFANGDPVVTKKSPKVLTNGTSTLKEPSKGISKKRKADDSEPEPSQAAQKLRKDVNGNSKQAEPLKANGVDGESSKSSGKRPEVSALQLGIRTKGLANRVNDCYRNSVLQLICSSSVFKEEVLKHSSDKCKIGFCVCCGLGSLILNHHFKSTSSYRNKTNEAIKDVMRLAKVLPRQFRGARQEDAAEYLHAILHSCKDQLTKGLKDDALKSNPIDKTFDGSFPSVLTCPKCNHRSFNKTDLPSLMLLPSIKPSQNRSHNTIYLKDILEDHFRPERVDATCEKCKFSGKKFTKQVEVEKLPRLLVLNVVRWTQACLRGGVVRADKIMNKLRYEEKMAMIENGQRVEYLLNAVVAHGGRSLSGGHYVSFVRQPDGTWALCNDQYVEQTTWATVAKADGMQAAILGYQRVD